MCLLVFDFSDGLFCRASHGVWCQILKKKNPFKMQSRSEIKKIMIFLKLEKQLQFQ